jgi:hypothetical protein
MAHWDSYRGVEPTTSPSVHRDSFFPKAQRDASLPLKLRLPLQPEVPVKVLPMQSKLQDGSGKTRDTP